MPENFEKPIGGLNKENDSKEIAARLRGLAPDDEVVSCLARALEAGFPEAAGQYYLSNLDKFRHVDPAVVEIIKREIIQEKNNE